MKGKKTLIEQMVAYFKEYDGAEGLPSFEKFADTVGLDGEEILRLSEKDPAIGRAYRRCLAILRDRLIDGALLKRYDSSFSKYLLDSLDRAAVGGGTEVPFEVEVKIV